MTNSEKAFAAGELVKAQKLIDDARNILCNLHVNYIKDAELYREIKRRWLMLYSRDVAYVGGEGEAFDYSDLIADLYKVKQ